MSQYNRKNSLEWTLKKIKIFLRIFEILHLKSNKKNQGAKLRNSETLSMMSSMGENEVNSLKNDYKRPTFQEMLYSN